MSKYPPSSWSGRPTKCQTRTAPCQHSDGQCLCQAKIDRTYRQSGNGDCWKQWISHCNVHLAEGYCYRLLHQLLKITLCNLYLVYHTSIYIYIFYNYDGVSPSSSYIHVTSISWICCWNTAHLHLPTPGSLNASPVRPAVGPMARQKRHGKAGSVERPSQAGDGWGLLEQLGTVGWVTKQYLDQV